MDPTPCDNPCILLQEIPYKERDGMYRASAGPGLTPTGELRLWIDADAVQGAPCNTLECFWRARVYPNASVDLWYDLRITVVYEGTLPDGFSAFDD